jgi:hypothetical protein
MRRDGWRVRHLPQMTIIHHVAKAGIRPRNIAQYAFASQQYAHKYFGPVRRPAYVAAVGLRHVLRLGSSLLDRGQGKLRREASLRALRTLAGRQEPPFEAPPATALRAGGPEAPANAVASRI